MDQKSHKFIWTYRPASLKGRGNCPSGKREPVANSVDSGVWEAGERSTDMDRPIRRLKIGA